MADAVQQARRIVMIEGHPDAGARHFCHALGAAAQ